MRPFHVFALVALAVVACPDPIPVLAPTVPGLAAVCEAGCGPRGARLFRGARGACYYVAGRSGRRQYVERACCR